MIIPEIILFIFFWLFLGALSAASLIGDECEYYPVYIFGPLNMYDKIKDKDKAYKINCRRKFFFLIGGGFSFIFMCVFWLLYGIHKLYNYIIFIFS